MRSFTETTTTTFKPEWIKREFLRYNEVYRLARKRMPSNMNTCQKCKKKFEDGEMMSLASFGKKGNKTLCQPCADYLLEPEESQ